MDHLSILGTRTFMDHLSILGTRTFMDHLSRPGTRTFRECTHAHTRTHTITHAPPLVLTTVYFYYRSSLKPLWNTHALANSQCLEASPILIQSFSFEPSQSGQSVFFRLVCFEWPESFEVRSQPTCRQWRHWMYFPQELFPDWIFEVGLSVEWITLGRKRKRNKTTKISVFTTFVSDFTVSAFS